LQILKTGGARWDFIWKAGGIVSNGHGEPKAVAELSLKFGFPGAGTATVAAASIGKYEQLLAAAVTASAVALHHNPGV